MILCITFNILALYCQYTEYSPRYINLNRNTYETNTFNQILKSKIKKKNPFRVR